jgi:hypothetical protein
MLKKRSLKSKSPSIMQVKWCTLPANQIETATTGSAASEKLSAVPTSQKNKASKERFPALGWLHASTPLPS